ncbi:MAG: SO_0444 family Cu/Zn efflux transporter [Methanosarcinaceae archaeon]
MSLETLPPILALFSGILLASWEIFVEAAPYLIFGFGIAGLLNILVPDQKIVEYLGSSAGKVRSVINASLAGLPLPLCSCGVIPAAMSIRKRGANRGATLSFLISTPQTGVDSIAITYALLDPLMTIFRPIATLVTAILAGLADNLLIGEEEKKGEKKKKDGSGKQTGLFAVSTLLETSARTSVSGRDSYSSCDSECGSICSPTCGCSSLENPVPGKTEAVNPMTLNKPSTEKISHLTLSTQTIPTKNHSANLPQDETASCGCSCGCSGNESKEDRKSQEIGKGKKPLQTRLFEGMKYAYIELLGDISKWMLIGILFAGIISYLVPESLIRDYLGGGLSSMLVMLVVGIPLYICATASTPLAATLVAKGMSPGAAFVFLLAGPATNAATVTMVARFLGKRSAALYLGVISLCALGAGVLLDFLYLKLGISATATLGSAGEMLPETVKLGFAALLLPLMLYGTFRQKKECGCH